MKIQIHWNTLVERHPALEDALLWPGLSERAARNYEQVMDERIALLRRRADIRELGGVRGLMRRALNPLAAACVYPPLVSAIAPAPVKHLLLYVVAAAVILAMAVMLYARRRTIVGALTLATMGALTGLDAIAWIRIADHVTPGGYPIPLWLIDCAAYVCALLAALSVWRDARAGSDASYGRGVFVAFSSYCFLACIFWGLLGTVYADSELASALRTYWGLDAYPREYGFNGVDGIRFMMWVVWLEYGISGAVSLYLPVYGVSMRATMRWLVVPMALYASAGPWVAGAPHAEQRWLLVFIVIAALDWLIVRYRRKQE